MNVEIHHLEALNRFSTPTVTVGSVFDNVRSTRGLVRTTVHEVAQHLQCEITNTLSICTKSIWYRYIVHPIRVVRPSYSCRTLFFFLSSVSDTCSLMAQASPRSVVKFPRKTWFPSFATKDPTFDVLHMRQECQLFRRYQVFFIANTNLFA